MASAKEPANLTVVEGNAKEPGNPVVQGNAKEPGNLTVVEGNLFDAKEQYVAHQCNCVTSKGAHLSGDMFERFPHANIYASRAKTGKRDDPGTIIIRGNEDLKERLIINMLGQFYPGKARFGTDTTSLRLLWFQSCLDNIALIDNLQSIAFPWNIGCGAAGGDWNKYLDLIHKFAASLPNVRITLYRLPTPKH